MLYHMFYTYLDLICYCLPISGLCPIILGICYISSDSNLYHEKMTGYECGFDPFPDARDPFNIKFYPVSILFIIFDVEIIFLFPWIMCQKYIFTSGFLAMYFSYIILVVGFAYE